MFLRRFLLHCLAATCAWLSSAGLSAHPWEKPQLWTTPQVFPAEKEWAKEGLEAFYFEGEPWHGKPTRVFAYLGLPDWPAGEKVPAMVLIHGGGGTAFPEWVKRWNKRGYAAIAMDTCGCLPGGENGKRPRHELGGPPGWGGFGQLGEAAEDQWSYHAVAAVIRAHSLLRSRPEVDPERIGVTGISWGGYLTCMVAGVDPRYRFAAPVYGCGFLMDNSTWVDGLRKLGSDKAEFWAKHWDPSAYLGQAKLPMLWVTGTNDFAFPLDSLQKSYRLAPGAHTLSVRVRMPHNQSAGESPEEIRAFAQQHLKQGEPLPTVSQPQLQDGVISATCRSGSRITSAELNYTRDVGPWQKRTWETLPLPLEGRDAHPTTSSSGATSANATVRARLPEGTCVAYINFTDDAGLVISSEHVDLAAGQ